MQDKPTAAWWLDRALVRIPDVQNILSVGRSKVYDLIGDGRLDVRKIDGRTLVTTASIVRLIDQLPVGVTPERYAPKAESAPMSAPITA